MLYFPRSLPLKLSLSDMEWLSLRVHQSSLFTKWLDLWEADRWALYLGVVRSLRALGRALGPPGGAVTERLERSRG